MLQRVIYTFWTGDNDMSHDRKSCLFSLVEKSCVDVRLITSQNLDNHLVNDAPLHPAYKYLSLTHKADYLRCYFMHHCGGGYSDIKKTITPWNKAFDSLESNELMYVNGYPELNEDCVAMVGGELYMKLRENYRKVVGCSAFICKSHSPFTLDWYALMNKRLDDLMPYLELYPARHPQDKFGMILDGQRSRYPLRWTEILGNIFHPLCLKYSDNILQSLPRCEFSHPYR